MILCECSGRKMKKKENIIKAASQINVGQGIAKTTGHFIYPAATTPHQSIHSSDFCRLALLGDLSSIFDRGGGIGTRHK